jgi:hypothetical protein
MPWHDEAVILLTKAKHDATIVFKATNDLEIEDDIVAFHAQQACEKWLRLKPLYATNIYVQRSCLARAGAPVYLIESAPSQWR